MIQFPDTQAPEVSTLDDFEEGTLYVPVRKHWWQFWLPKQVVAGVYWTIGGVTTLYAFEAVWEKKIWGKA